jgi:hypothetical protein
MSMLSKKRGFVMPDQEHLNGKNVNLLIKNALSLVDTLDADSFLEDLASMVRGMLLASQAIITIAAPESSAGAALPPVQREPDGTLIINLAWADALLAQCRIEGAQAVIPESQLGLVATVLGALVHYANNYSQLNRQLYGLNTYLTISTNIQNSLNLNEQLQWVIYLCMDAVNASAASVLLLTQDEQQYGVLRRRGGAERGPVQIHHAGG